MIWRLSGSVCAPSCRGSLAQQHAHRWKPPDDRTNLPPCEVFLLEIGGSTCRAPISSTHEKKGYVSRFALPSKLRPSFNMQVLVADDQGINRKLMCQLLSTFNSSWQLVECATAEEAILAAKSNFFPLIVMDEEFGAGVMTGSEAIAAIRSIEAAQGTSDDKSAFIVSWTAKSSSLGIPTGANSTWQKPADREIMQVDIDRALQVVE